MTDVSFRVSSTHSPVLYFFVFLIILCCFSFLSFFLSSRRLHTRCALVTVVQTCALPIYVDLADYYAYDPGKAKALLAEAGHANGLTLALKLPPPPYARRSGEVIAAQLATIGVKTDIFQLEWAQWLEQVFKGKDYDLTIVSHTEPMDIGIYARDDYYFNYRNADFKALMAKAEATVDENARNALLAEAQKKLAADAVNVFLFQLAKHGVWDRDVVGLWENSPVQANGLTEVYWK